MRTFSQLTTSLNEAKSNPASSLIKSLDGLVDMTDKMERQYKGLINQINKFPTMGSQSQHKRMVSVIVDNIETLAVSISDLANSLDDANTPKD